MGIGLLGLSAWFPENLFFSRFSNSAISTSPGIDTHTVVERVGESFAALVSSPVAHVFLNPSAKNSGDFLFKLQITLKT